MRAAGPVKRDFPLMSSAALEEVARLIRTASTPLVQLRSEALSLTLRGARG